MVCRCGLAVLCTLVFCTLYVHLSVLFLRSRVQMCAVYVLMQFLCCVLIRAGEQLTEYRDCCVVIYVLFCGIELGVLWKVRLYAVHFGCVCLGLGIRNTSAVE